MTKKEKYLKFDGNKYFMFISISHLVNTYNIFNRVIIVGMFRNFEISGFASFIQ